MAQLDLSTIRHALGLARERGFAEVSLELGATKFKASLQPERRTTPRTAAPLVPGDAVASAEPEFAEVCATLVGYAQPPRQPVQVGDAIEPGHIVASITALGIATDVESTVGGEVIEVLFEANQPVMYGQPLLRVKP